MRPRTARLRAVSPGAPLADARDRLAFAVPACKVALTSACSVRGKDVQAGASGARMSCVIRNTSEGRDPRRALRRVLAAWIGAAFIGVAAISRGRCVDDPSIAPRRARRQRSCPILLSKDKGCSKHFSIFQERFLSKKVFETNRNSRARRVWRDRPCRAALEGAWRSCPP